MKKLKGSKKRQAANVKEKNSPAPVGGATSEKRRKGKAKRLA